MVIMLQPKIGITMRMELSTRRFYLGRDYSEAVFAAGGLPLHFPLIPDRDLIGEFVNGVDGILLPGSDTDTDPAKYGEDPHPRLGRVIPEKDETDLLVIEAAEKAGKPIFGICFGMQILNVSRGGSLIQDINAQVNDPIKHEQGEPLQRHSHQIRIENGLLSSIIGDNADNGAIRVNSHHHQAVKTVGHGLRATAWASDGVIEAVEDVSDGRFVLGVQWHPELSWDTDAVSKALFEGFIKECG